MVEIRCPVCNKKIAETGRPPVSYFTYVRKCKHCGKEVNAKIKTEHKSNEIIAILLCACGCRKERVVGHLVSVKCRKCKTIVKF